MDETRLNLFQDGVLINHLYNHPDRIIKEGSKEFKSPFVVLIRCFIFLGLLPFTLMFISNLHYGTLIIEGDGVGLLEDYNFLFFIVLYSFIAFGVYLFFERYRSFFYKIQHIIDKDKLIRNVPNTNQKGLRAYRTKQKLSDIIWIITGYRIKIKRKEIKSINIKGKEAYNQYLSKISQIICGKKTPVLRFIYFVATILSAILFFNYIKTGGTQFQGIDYYFDVQKYPGNFFFNFFYFIFFFTFVYYFVIWKMFTTCLSLNLFIREMKDAIVLKFFEADGVGGMSPLGNTALAFHFVILLPFLGSMLSIYIHGLSKINAVSLSLYLPLVIIVFFIPFISAHSIMKRHKEKQLSFLSSVHERFVKKWKQCQRNHDCPTRNFNDNEEREIMEMSEQIRGYYKDIKTMPVWPFNLSILGRFATSLLIPVILILLQIILN